MNKKLYRDGPYEDFFSQGVLVGNILTLAGQIGVDEEGNSPEDIKGQMVICYKNICNVLTHFGGTLENVIDETWFVTNVDECMKNVTEIEFFNVLSGFRGPGASRMQLRKTNPKKIKKIISVSPL